MTHAVFTNNARTTLSGSLTNVATSASVVDGSVFPAPTGGDYAYLTIEEGSTVEIVKLTARSTNTLTITRAQDGTTGQAFTTAATVSLRLPRIVLDEFQAAIDGKQAQDAELSAIAGLTSAADSLPYFTGSGTAALATFTAAGRALVDDADAAAQRTTLGVAIGTNVQAYDAGLQSIAGLTTAADTMIYTTALDTYATTALTAAGRALIDDADAAAQRTTLGVAIGTNVQAYDAGLQSIAGLTTAADRGIYTTASDTYAVYTLTAAGRAILDDADAAAQRTTLGLGTAATVNTGTSGATIPLLNGANTFSATQTLSAALSLDIVTSRGGNPETTGSTMTTTGARFLRSGIVGLDAGVYASGAIWLQMRNSTDFTSNFPIVLNPNGGAVQIGASHTVWHAGNDGAGSGLDADLLDGNNIGTSGNTVPLLSGTNTWSGNQTISSPSELFFGSGTRQMLNLWGTTFAIGVQSNTQYYRSGNRFSWFIGGVHSGTEDDPGAGGTRIMTMASTGIVVGTGTVSTDGSVRTRKTGSNIEWGHTTAAYHNALGAEAGSGAGFLTFGAFAGATSNTYRTTGLLGAGVRSNNAGGMVFFTLTNSNADNQSPTDRMTLLASGELTITDVGPTSTLAAGYRGAPRNRQDSSYTLVLADAGKSIVGYGSTASQTWTIPANGSVAYPIGTTITFVNMRSVACSIACTTDTMYFAGTGATGTRTLASYSWATAIKVDTNNWMIGGTGLT